MADPSTLGNPSNVSPGPPDSAISESARLIKGDAGKDIKLLQQFLSDLKSAEAAGATPGLSENVELEFAKLHPHVSKPDLKQLNEAIAKLKSAQLSKLKNILDAYQVMLSKESRDDPGKAAAFNAWLHSLQSDPGLIDLLNGIAKGGTGAEALAAALVSAIANMEGTSPIPGPQGTGGDPPPPEHLELNFEEVKKTYVKMTHGRPKGIRLAIGGFAALALLLVLFFGVRRLTPALGSPTTDPPGVIAPNLASPVVPPATPVCALNFLNPADPASIPDTGPFNVQWSSQPGAASYALKVIPPASFSVPWLFPTQGYARTIYMENFPAAGDYQFSVDALDGNGDVLCSTALKFKRSAYVAPSGKKSDTGGGGGATCRPGVVYVTCP